MCVCRDQPEYGISLMWKYQHFTRFWKIYGRTADFCTTATVALATVHTLVPLHWCRCFLQTPIWSNTFIKGRRMFAFAVQIGSGGSGKDHAQEGVKSKRANQSKSLRSPSPWHGRGRLRGFTIILMYTTYVVQDWCRLLGWLFHRAFMFHK